MSEFVNIEYNGKTMKIKKYKLWSILTSSNLISLRDRHDALERNEILSEETLDFYDARTKTISDIKSFLDEDFRP